LRSSAIFVSSATVRIGVASQAFSARHFVDPQLCFLIASVRDGHVKAAEIRREERRPRAGRGRNPHIASIMIRVLLIEDGDETLAARDINPLSRGVIPEVIRVADRIEVRDDPAACRVESEELGRAARHDEKPMVFRVERHGKIRLILLHRPTGDDGAPREC
jgi:hypothetical protein